MAKRGSHGRSPLTRRGVLIAGVAVPRLGALAQATATPDIKAASSEGALVVWHGDQEADVVEFLKIFTQKTGVQTVQQRLLPGAALPKLEAEFRTGTSDVDAYMTSDAGIMENLRLQN